MFGAKLRKYNDFCVPLPMVLICFRKMKKVLFAFAALIALADLDLT